MCALDGAVFDLIEGEQADDHSGGEEHAGGDDERGLHAVDECVLGMV